MAELIWKDKLKREDTSVNTTKTPHLITTEVINHLAENQSPLIPSASTNTEPWYNRLILGDKQHVLPALLTEFAGKINLIYIDPPFMTGRDFKSGERLAYSDKWGNNLDTYLQWLYETLVLLHQLLAPTGSLYLHLDWRVTHYAKVLLDEVFGFSINAVGAGFKNEIIWHYQSGGR